MEVKKKRRIKESLVSFLKAVEVSNLLVFLAIVLISSVTFLFKSNNSALVSVLGIVFSLQLHFSLGLTLFRIILEYAWEGRFFGFPVRE